MLVHIYKGGPMLTIHDLERINIEKSSKVFASISMNDQEKK